MDTSTDRFIVVVGIDFSEQADQALDAALEDASRREHAELHVVHVEPDPWMGADVRHHAMGPDTTVERVLRRTREHMARVAQAGRIRRVVAHYRRGSAAEGIARLAADLGAHLIIVGSYGRGGAGPLRGSVAEGVVELARCSVRIVPVTGRTVADATHELRHSEPPSGEHRRWCASNGVYAAEMTVYERPPQEQAIAPHG